MNIDLNDENMRAVIGNAIMQTLTAETRSTVIAQAIENLLTPPAQTSSYGPKPKSPLQEAFDRALNEIAKEEVRKVLNEDESIKNKISELVGAAANQLFENKDESIQKIADAMSSSLSRVDNY